MSQLKYCGALVLLAVLSLEDIKKREISVNIALIGALSAFIYLLIGEQISGIKIVCGLLPGIGLLLLSLATKESIGRGDGIVTMALGLWLGGTMTFLVVCLAMWIAGIFAIVYLIQKRRELIPFVPCLLIGMEVLLCYV